MDEKISVQQFADTVIWRAMLIMQEHGVPFEVMIDRLVTTAGAHVVKFEGRGAAVTMFRRSAETVENGAFAQLETGPTIN